MDKEQILQHHRNILRLKVTEGVKQALRYAAAHKVPCSKKHIEKLQSCYINYYHSLLDDSIPADGQILSLNQRVKFLSHLSLNPFHKTVLALPVDEQYKYLQVNCWLWTAGITHDGYGRMRVGAKRHYAHVISYNLFCRTSHKPSKDSVLMHSCDTPACCNPYHLNCDSQRVNVLDMGQKGRSRYYGGASIASEAERYLEAIKDLK